MTSTRPYLVFNSLLLAACLLDFSSTQYALRHHFQEANPWAPLGFGPMALTTAAIFCFASALFFLRMRALVSFDQPSPADRTTASFMGTLNASPLRGIAFGLAPLPIVILILKATAGVENVLLLTYDHNLGTALRPYVGQLTVTEYFAMKMIVLGSTLYVISYALMLRRWRRTGSLLPRR
jgi:hypothetical protein